MLLTPYRIVCRGLREQAHLEAALSLAPRVVYDERNRLVAYGDVLCKMFRPPSFLRAIYYRFFPSKAARSYDNSLELLARGVPAPTPLAYGVEYRRGRLRRSFYACAYLPEFDTVRGLVNGEYDDPALLSALAAFLYRLHTLDVYHRDLSPGNVLYRKEPDGCAVSFCLVDVNRLCFRRLSDTERWANLSRLCYDRDLSGRLAREYARASGDSPERVVEVVQRAGDEFFERTVAKWIYRAEKHRPPSDRHPRRLALAILLHHLRRKRRGGFWEWLYRYERRVLTPDRLALDLRGAFRLDYDEEA